MTTSTTIPKTCPTCGASFAPYRPQQVYCGASCRITANRMTVNATRSPRGTGQRQRTGETAAILPSDRIPVRREPMSDEEFAAIYGQIQRELLDAGRPLFDTSWRGRTATMRGGEAR